MSNLEVPNQFKQICTIVKYELIKYIRGKKIHAIFGLSIFVSLLIVLTPVIFEIPLSETVVSYLQSPLNFIFYFIVIAVAFFGSNALVSEFHDKTGYTLFPNPISRTTIWFGKFIGAEIMSFSVIGVYFGVISFSALYNYEKLPFELLLSLLFSFIVTTAIMSIAFLISASFRSPTGAVVTVFLLFILVFPIIDQIVMTFAEIKPWFSPTFSSSIIQNILTVPYPTDVIPGELPRGPFDFEQFVPYVDESLVMFTVYILGCSILSIFIFRMREMV